jgi:O-methyltransferase domain
MIGHGQVNCSHFALPMTSRASLRSSMSVAPPGTCWATSSSGTLNREASSSIARMSSRTRRRCCARTEWKAESRSSTGASSTAFLGAGTPTSCRTSFTIGTRISWNEDQCLTILGNCRKAMKRGARLLIVEFVLPEGDTPHFGKIVDM